MNIILTALKDFIRRVYYFSYDILDFKGREILKRNISLSDKYRGERAFILGTGESLNTIDITMLKDEFTLGTNLIFLHDEIKHIDLNMFVLLDNYRNTLPQWPENHVGPNGYDGKEQIYKEIDEKLIDTTTLILPRENYKCINNVINDKTKFFVKAKKNLYLNNELSNKIVTDLTKRKICAMSSIYSSIMVLMYFGFKEIYLCGQGYTYNPEYVFHFYDNIVFPKSIGKNEAIHSIKNELAVRKEKGGSAEYYGLLEKGDYFRGICIRRKNENNPQHYKNHRKIKKYADSQGVKIINIVPKGFESPVYEKINWAKVVSEVLPNK
jgi:hypothetical protein